MTDYRHTQTAPLCTILLVAALVIALSAAWAAPTPAVKLPVYAGALALCCLAFCFQTLTVEDLGPHLRVRYGSIPVFRTHLRYAEMTGATVARSKFIDGWGIHYVPGRGWTYNLWGFDCVEIQLGNRTVRVGTDDPHGLAEFLQTRLAAKSSP